MQAFGRRTVDALPALFLSAVPASSASVYIDEADRDHAAVVKMLLAAGADPNALDALGATALTEAAGTGNADNIRALLAAGADVGAANEGGRAALHWTAWTGHAEAAGIQLAAGADPDASTDDGLTPCFLRRLRELSLPIASTARRT